MFFPAVWFLDNTFIRFLWACLGLHPTFAAWENGAFFH
jgi:hypothetical protein